MTQKPTSERNTSRAVALVAVALLGFVVASSVDGLAYRTLVDAAAERQDWAKMLRSCGYWPTWLLIGLAMVIIDWRERAPVWPKTDRWTRGVLLWVSTGMGGLAAEMLKLIARRERPDMTDGAYVFRSIGDHLLSTSGLGLPSSHAAVAFAASWVLTRLYPAAMPLWLGLGVGCSLTRVLDRAHFLSDVYAGALVGIGVAELLWRAHVRNHAARLGPRDGGMGADA